LERFAFFFFSLLFVRSGRFLNCVLSVSFLVVARLSFLLYILRHTGMA